MMGLRNGIGNPDALHWWKLSKIYKGVRADGAGMKSSHTLALSFYAMIQGYARRTIISFLIH
jgi:hypothetical protein